MHRGYLNQWEFQCENLGNQKIKFFGRESHANELIFHPHIEEDHTNILPFSNKKIN